MTQDFTVNWAFAIQGTVERMVRQHFPQNLRSWPLLNAFEAEAYKLPENYAVIILRDRLSGIPFMGDIKDNFPHVGFPVLPPKVDDIELWQFYLKNKFSLQAEDSAFLIPYKESANNDASKDYEQFSAEEQRFWHKQIVFIISQYHSHLQNMTKPAPTFPSNITYNLSGAGARVNVNSTDSSVNVISTEVSKVFTQVRQAVSQIPEQNVKIKIELAVTEMEQAYGSDNFLQKYQAFIALAANHMAVLAPIVPALTGLLA